MLAGIATLVALGVAACGDGQSAAESAESAEIPAPATEPVAAASAPAPAPVESIELALESAPPASSQQPDPATELDSVGEPACDIGIARFPGVKVEIVGGSQFATKSDALTVGHLDGRGEWSQCVVEGGEYVR